MHSVKTVSYHHTAYPSAWLAGACGLLYSVSFVLISKASPNLGAGLSGFFLLTGGIFGASALVGLYERLAPAGGGYALWALVFGLAGALAATLHGGYDLANAIHPPDQSTTLPSAVDPRGLGTFGIAGLAVLAFAYLMSRDSAFPSNLAYLGYLSGGLLVAIYLARLIILSPANPIVLAPAALEGFIVNPAWYIWLGFVLRRGA